MPRSRITLIAALAALGTGLAALFFWGADDPAGPPLHATVLPEPLPLPEFALRDQHDEPFTRDSLRGQSSLLFFGFTHCPDICPATLQQLVLARKEIAGTSNGRARPLPRIILISVDPERDTAGKLKQYVGYFGEGVDAATGSPEAVREFTSALGIFFEKQALDAGAYTVSHSTAVLFVDEGAALRALFSAPHKTEYFVHDVPLLMAAR